jgi:ATP-binding cassette, subfamily B, bacterial MsbA
MLLAATGTIIGALTEPMIPALLKSLLDKGFASNAIALWMVPASLMGLFGMRGLAGFIAQYALTYTASIGLIQMRQAMFERLTCADLRLFKDQNASALSNTLVYEVQNGSSTLVNAFLTLTKDSLTLAALMGYLFILNWRLTLIVLIIFPALVWIMRSLSKRLYALTQSSQKATDRLAYVVEENVLAHRMIRLQGAQQQQQDRFNALSQQLKRLSLKATISSAAMTPLTQMLAAAALSAVISIALWQSHHTGATVGEFVSFVTAMLMLVAPIKHLAEIAGPITRGVAALERGLNLIDQVPPQAEGTYAPPHCKGHIELRQAVVRYSDDVAPALDHISLSIQPGEVVALVGPSGSGKTTIANALPRFVDLASGQILLDGVDISQWRLQTLRQQFAMVSQDVIMLNDTLAANVALGQPIRPDDVLAALESAHLLDWVKRLPNGIESTLGHNASELSGGQRQRLAIARAIYKNAPILILDEATSALDNESERLVQDALKRLMKGRTTLTIAHRLSTIEHADRVVVMSEGCILEQGTHHQLLASGGLYAKLHQPKAIESMD